MAIGRRIRILIVDDSAVMRSLLRSVVCADAGLEVAGTAADGASALMSLEALHPDIMLLDVEMPVMDGLATLRELRRRGYTLPVIMCSSLTQRGAKVTLEALSGGASDYVAKPAGQANREAAILALGLDLAPKIRALTSQGLRQYQDPNPTHFDRSIEAHLAGPNPAQPPLGFPGISSPPVFLSQAISSQPTVLVIGVSTGGPAALEVLLPALPENFPLPVMVVQHMPELFTKLFAERLDGRCKLSVREAAQGDPVRVGTVSIARGNWHMEVLAVARGASSPTLRLSQGLAENHCRPAVDVLFRSAAAVYGKGVLAVVLTGMGSDGMIGCRFIRHHGGTVLAQDRATSTVWGMPGAVINAGLAHKVLSLIDMAPEILRLASRSHTHAGELSEAAV